MDFGTPVAAGVNVNPAGGLKTISDLMGLKQQQQQIQSSGLTIQQQQAQLPAVQAESNITQMKAAEQQKVSQAFQSGVDEQGNSIRDANGEIDPAKALPMLGRIAPLTGQPIAQNVLKTHNDKVSLQGAVQGLDMTHRKALAGIVQAAAVGSDPTDIATGINQYVEQHPEAKLVGDLANTFVTRIGAAPPEQRANLSNKLSAMLQTGQTVQTQPQGAAVSTGAQTLQGTVAPPVTGGGFTAQTAVKNEVPPGMAAFQDQAGNTWAFNPQNPGQAQMVGQGGQGTAPASVAIPSDSNFKVKLPNGDTFSGNAAEATAKMQALAQAGDYKGAHELQSTLQAAMKDSVTSAAQKPPSLSVGEAGQVKSNVDTVTSTRKMAEDSLTNHDILQRIQGIASTPGLYLGPGSQNVAQLATAVSGIPGFEGAAKYANNYNELAKFMAQNAARMGKQMGLEGSDARLDLAMHSQPNTQMDARTVQHVAQYMAGLTRMSLAKAGAMDKWLAQPGHTLQNEQQFEQMWRENADPRLFQLAEMKDQGEAANYAKLHIRKGEQDALNKKHEALAGLGVW